jgi:hypothetical protein
MKRRSPRLRVLLDWLPVAVAAVLAVAVYVFVPVVA